MLRHRKSQQWGCIHQFRSVEGIWHGWPSLHKAILMLSSFELYLHLWIWILYAFSSMMVEVNGVAMLHVVILHLSLQSHSIHWCHICSYIGTLPSPVKGKSIPMQYHITWCHQSVLNLCWQHVCICNGWSLDWCSQQNNQSVPNSTDQSW